MTRALLGGLAVFLLAGCAPPAQKEAPTTEQLPPTSAKADTMARPVSHEELFGQWRLVAMPGLAAGEDPQIHLLIGRYAIEAVSQCVPFGTLLPGAVLSEPPPPRSDPVCQRGLTRIEQRFGPALASVRSIERGVEGRVLLRGADGTLVIERQTEPVLNPFRNAPGPGPYLMWGEWRIAELNGAEPPSPMTALFFRNRLEIGSGCVHFGRRLEQEGPTLRLGPDPIVTTICERMTSPAEDAAERVLSGAVTIAESSPRRRLLRGAAGTILLER